ncbi:hypothetical protein J2128_001702 [Methanomicrobium sp. W14]|nr:hypothetical protein [Methanomicrobium sp. W14]MBP2133748.1 hypothetical protein [Methanomicrobium sp. W14]
MITMGANCPPAVNAAQKLSGQNAKTINDDELLLCRKDEHTKGVLSEQTF